MRSCPFPNIPDYLSRQRFPDDAIPFAAVTHIWTQDRTVSEHVASASRIAHVVGDPRDMLGEVDAILLARDDAQNHFSFAAPFLNAGLPTYIDKPLALDEASARRLVALQRWPGQLFTCSAVRYGSEFQLSEEQRQVIGPIRFIQGIVANDWDRYAVHVIDPAICLMGKPPGVLAVQTWVHDGVTSLSVAWDNGVQGNFSTLGKGRDAPLALRIVGTHGSRSLVFDDDFPAFKKALEDFVLSVRTRRPVHDVEIDLAVVRLIEVGRSAV
jgi:predicted dehydrogenase